MSWESIGHELQRQLEPTNRTSQEPKENENHLTFLAPTRTNRAFQHKLKANENDLIFWLPEPTEHDRTPQQEAKAKPP